MPSIKGKIDGDKIILNLTDPSMSYKQTWEYRDGKLRRVVSGKDSKTGKAFSVEAVFTRKQ